MNRIALVMIGAAFGGLARYVVGSLLLARYSAKFPLGTLIVNVTGCFFIGILMTFFIQRGDPNPNLRLLLVTGVLGGFTTFSTFGWETFEAIDQDRPATGLLNIVLSVVAGYVAVWCGALIARSIR